MNHVPCFTVRSCSIITSRLGAGSSPRDRPISIEVLHVFRDSECEAGGWVAQSWQFQRDVVIDQPLLLV